MKILNQKQIRETDAFTIKNEPIASIDLMERAASQFVKRLLKKVLIQGEIHIFCGKGNNGGDGLVAARLLMNQNYVVTSYIIEYSNQASEDFVCNYDRLKNTKTARIIHLDENSKFPRIENNDVVIDAMWGTGLCRPIEGFSKSIIEKINRSDAKIIALDIPSGLFCDGINSDSSIVQSDYTISLQTPKLCFFLADNHQYVKNWEVVDIGLSKEFIDNLDVSYYLTEKKEIKKAIQSRNPFDHKGNFGHALLISGSTGKMGAAILAAAACLRSGAGLLTVQVPKSANSLIQIAVPESMSIADSNENCFSEIPDLTSFSAIGIGPGIGTDTVTQHAFSKLIQQVQKPLVIDADGINMLALNPALLKELPDNTIITPHIGEFDRLAGRSENQFERLSKAKEIAIDNQITIVLKGKYTAIVRTDGKVFFNPSGNPGMATAGSGDVLTGMILGFLSQNYATFEAAKIAVYLHGMAGDYAANKFTEISMKASDIIDHIPKAIKKLLN
ncbi:MAG: NAD(P)H-hydrate dehydratase [Bacteroidetes bacterium]|nr:NAD(P)H-hydrate dehydratase [Bacteroidota bacterium]